LKKDGDVYKLICWKEIIIIRIKVLDENKVQLQTLSIVKFIDINNTFVVHEVGPKPCIPVFSTSNDAFYDPSQLYLTFSYVSAQRKSYPSMQIID
jgi:hypothetical protein